MNGIPNNEQRHRRWLSGAGSLSLPMVIQNWSFNYLLAYSIKQLNNGEMKTTTQTDLARERIFDLLGVMTQALASPTRLRIVQILTSRPCTVEVLSERTEESMANTSQHLQKLLKAGIVTCEKQGVSRVYRLANEKVIDVWLSLQDLAQQITPQMDDEASLVCPPELVAEAPLKEIKKMLKAGKAVLVDVREEAEFEATPAPTAVHMPIKNFKDSLELLPRSKMVFIFCRGAYCSMANPAVELLRKKGYRAFRLRENSYQLREYLT